MGGLILALALISCGGGGGGDTDRPTNIFLRLPFAGEWIVVPPPAESPHVILWTLDPAGGGAANGDHPAFGRPVLAPAAGRVGAVVGDVPDHAPGEPDTAHPWGNHVILDHQDGEYSVLGWLAQGSLTTAPGDTVYPGQPLGRCGNSGGGDRPAIRFHLSLHPSGKPAVVSHFRPYSVDGSRVILGIPAPGERTATLWKNRRFEDEGS